MGCGDPHSSSTIEYTSNRVAIEAALFNFIFSCISGFCTVVHSEIVSIQYPSRYFTMYASNRISSNN